MQRLFLSTIDWKRWLKVYCDTTRYNGKVADLLNYQTFAIIKVI